MGYVPERGDVVWITVAGATGHEQAGRRPALVVSPAAYNARVGLAIFCPLTRQVKGYPFGVAVPEGLPVEGVVLADQVKCLDWRARTADFACSLPSETTGAVLQRLVTLLTP